MNEPNLSIEQRVARLETYVLTQGENLKQIAGGIQAIAEIPGYMQSMNAMFDDVSRPLNLLVDAMVLLGPSLLVLDTRQLAMIKYLGQFNAPVDTAAKEIFLDTIARQESVTEKLEHFIKVMELMRNALKQKGEGESSSSSSES